MAPLLFRAALFVALLVPPFLAMPAAHASETRYLDPSDPVVSGKPPTYADLALQFAPGLGKTPIDTTELEKLPNLVGDTEPEEIETVAFGSVERMDLTLDGKPLMLLLYDLGSAEGTVASVSVLALYDMTGTPKLMDALNIGLDRETSFSEQSYLPVSDGLGVAVVRNSHHNAGEEFLQTSLIGLWGGKLHEVETVLSMTWLTGAEDITTIPRFAVVPGKQAFDASFDITHKVCDEECSDGGEPTVTNSRITARYSWDPAKGQFVRPAKALDGIPLPDMEE